MTQKNVMKDIELKTDARLEAINSEKKALNALIDTLTHQNRNLVSELEI